MKKVVIAGSAKLQGKIDDWLKVFESQNYEILDYPKAIEKSKFIEFVNLNLKCNTSNRKKHTNSL